MGQFVLKNIDMTLDPDSIQAAIDEVLKLKTDLADALAEFTKVLTAQGAEIAQMYIIQMDAVWTGLLSEVGMQWEYDIKTHEGHVFTDIEYAVLVEYGTGYVGKNHPHPGISDPEWKNPESTNIFGHEYSSYDQNEHKEKGWYYPAPWGWIIGSKGDSLAWTMGRPSKPFMYRTFRDLEAEAEARGATFIAQYIP